MSGLSLGTCLSHLKSVALTILELLAFNAAARAHTQTYIERKQCLRHSVHFRSPFGEDNDDHKRIVQMAD